MTRGYSLVLQQRQEVRLLQRAHWTTMNRRTYSLQATQTVHCNRYRHKQIILVILILWDGN